MISPFPRPESQKQLMQRAHALAGKTIGEVAHSLNIIVPETLKRKKGWQGQFIEACLGADSGSLSQPDFPHLKIELKTLPIDYQGKVLESTYVSVLNLTSQQLISWQQSPVYHKLQKVLWVPIARKPQQNIMLSRIATPFLWCPTPQQQQTLKMDWENAVEMVNLGKVDQLNAKIGEYLQVRPKAANAKALTSAYNQQGEKIATLPRGFYLRSHFTQQILQENLKLN